MSEPPRSGCRRCVFFSKEDSTCRFNPPVVSERQRILGVNHDPGTPVALMAGWPIVGPADWCGKFEA